MAASLGRSLAFHVVFEGRLLENDHGEFSVGRDHDLIHLGSDLDEENLLIRVQMLDDLVSFVFELSDQGAIDNGILWLHCGSY